MRKDNRPLSVKIIILFIIAFDKALGLPLKTLTKEQKKIRDENFNLYEAFIARILAILLLFSIVWFLFLPALLRAL